MVSSSESRSTLAASLATIKSEAPEIESSLSNVRIEPKGDGICWFGWRRGPAGSSPGDNLSTRYWIWKS